MSCFRFVFTFLSFFFRVVFSMFFRFFVFSFFFQSFFRSLFVLFSSFIRVFVIFSSLLGLLVIAFQVFLHVCMGVFSLAWLVCFFFVCFFLWVQSIYTFVFFFLGCSAGRCVRCPGLLVVHLAYEYGGREASEKMVPLMSHLVLLL